MSFCICTPIPRNENPIYHAGDDSACMGRTLFRSEPPQSADSVAFAPTTAPATTVPSATIPVVIRRRCCRGVKYDGHLGGRPGQLSLDGLRALHVSQRDAGRCLALVIRGRVDRVYSRVARRAHEGHRGSRRRPSLTVIDLDDEWLGERLAGPSLLVVTRYHDQIARTAVSGEQEVTAGASRQGRGRPYDRGKRSAWDHGSMLRDRPARRNGPDHTRPAHLPLKSAFCRPLESALARGVRCCKMEPPRRLEQDVLGFTEDEAHL